MATLVTAPDPILHSSGRDKIVFLAGSIDMGAAADWQKEFWEKVRDEPKLTVLNPRRKHWDVTWEQSITNPNFKEQVTWELDGIEHHADVVAIYIAPNSKAPITLLEYGISVKIKPESTFICFPNDYYRKGNLEVCCERWNIKRVSSLDELIKYTLDYNIWDDK